MQTSSQNKMAVQPIAPLMFRIGLPIVLSMILQAAYNVVDSAYLARMTTGGEDALTALSLAFPVQLFMVAVSIGTGVGTNALLAKLLGLGDRGSANRTVGNAQTLAIILSAVFMLFSLLGVRPYVYPQSAGGSISPEVLDMAIDYLHICCGIPFGIVLFSVYEKVLQATGRSLYSTIAQIAGAVVNIILDPFLIYGWCGLPQMGVRGAAMATVVGQLVSMALGLAFQTRDDMLDVLGDAGKMGKATGMDENKNTFVRLYGVGACSRLIEKETQKSIEALGVFEDSEFLKELSMKLAIREC